MNTRQFGNTGEQVSEVGLGCWQIGGGDWGAVSEQDALATMNAAVGSGVTFFDTADVYGLGRSETLIGRFLKQTTERVFVATKLGRFPEPGWPLNFEPQAIRAHTEASLKRLNVEALDLTQLHCIPTEVLLAGDVFETLRELKSEGKIRNFGVSVETMEEAVHCVRQSGVSSLQIIFNIFRQKPIETLFDLAIKNNVAIIVRLPLASGLLTGKFSRNTQFAASDHRNYNRNGQAFNVGETFAGLPFEKGVELAGKVDPLVPDGMSMTEMALRWCLDFEAVSVIIPGAKNPEQAGANSRPSALSPLLPELHEQLRKLYSQEVAVHIRGPY